MKIIEFNGVPGCGKSTICREICKYYEKNTEKRIIFYKNPLHKNMIIKIPQCFWVLCKTLIDKERRKLLFLLIHLNHMTLCQNGLKKEILYQFQYLFKIVLITDYCKKKNRKNETDVILIDQGITQYIVSALYEINYKCENIEYFFSKIDFYTDDCYVIECMADIKTVMDRLKKRKNGKSRIDRLDYAEREEKLLYQKAIFDDTRKGYRKYIKNVIRIDTTNVPPYENAQMIMEKI